MASAAVAKSSSGERAPLSSPAGVTSTSPVWSSTSAGGISIASPRPQVALPGQIMSAASTPRSVASTAVGDKATTTRQVIGLSKAQSRRFAQLQEKTKEKLTPASEKLHALLESHWRWRLENSPELATFVGDFANANALDDRSQEQMESSYRQLLHMLESVRSFPAHELTEYKERMHLAVLVHQLRTVVQGVRFRTFLMPVHRIDGPQRQFPFLLRHMRYSSVRDYVCYLSRLRGFEKKTEQLVDLMRQGLAEGMTPPRLAMTGMLEHIRSGLAVPPEETGFFVPLRAAEENVLTANTTQGDVLDEENVLRFDSLESLRAKGARIIQESVQPAFQQLLDFVEKEYMPALRPLQDISCASLPNGEALYMQCLRFHTDSDTPAAELHKMGLSEVERISGLMSNVLRAAHYTGSMQSFGEHLAEQPQLHYQSREQMLEHVNHLCRQVEEQLAEVFPKPNLSYKVMEFPIYQKEAWMSMYYFTPSFDTRREGKLFINTHYSKRRNMYEMVAYTLHYIGGWHVPMGLAIESDLPNFRKLPDMVRVGDAPCRFPLYSAYRNGLALYCESLGDEMGLYNDPYQLFGYNKHSMLAACGLVVDTGIHAMGWTHDQAMEFIMKHVPGLPRAAVEEELVRVMVWPGHACSFKVGEMKIQDLRTKAKTELRSLYNNKAFHTVLVEGSMLPLPVLATEVDRYIKRVQADKVAADMAILASSS
eukprot:jgi/Chlat1/6467/Chrsp45S05967